MDMTELIRRFRQHIAEKPAFGPFSKTSDPAIVETLGRAGLILCPAYDIDEPDIPQENVLAFLDAVRDYG